VKLGRDIKWDTDLAVIGILVIFQDIDAFEGFITSRLDGDPFKCSDSVLD
jgi:hypothetical protein